MRKEAREEQYSAVSASAPTSPSHEFSFTLSFHPSSTALNNKSTNQTSFAADMSPADDIFFHGRLLPLHFLSHAPVTPRSSTDSSEGFSFPMRLDGQGDWRPNSHSNRSNCSKNVTSTRCGEVEGGIKSKSFTLFWSEKWRKSAEVGEKEKEKKKMIMKFKVSCVLKYFRSLNPLFLLKGRKKTGQLRKQDFSFSRNSNLEEFQQWGQGAELSAPASIRTSPINSGFLSPATHSNHNKNDSTIEELQSAIQAAIIHCKNSIAKDEEKLQIQD